MYGLVDWTGSTDNPVPVHSGFPPLKTPVQNQNKQSHPGQDRKVSLQLFSKVLHSVTLYKVSKAELEGVLR